MSGSIEVRGLAEALKKLEPALLDKPLGTFLKKAAMVVQAGAQRKAPVDTGRLRASITYELDDGKPPLWAKVGTNVKYAPYIEFGTGTMTDGVGGKGGAHWPPGAALDTWARRHGFESGFQVAWKIGIRGGLKPRRFLRGALEESMGRIRGFIGDLESDIRAAWER